MTHGHDAMLQPVASPFHSGHDGMLNPSHHHDGMLNPSHFHISDPDMH
jgi:hypothetical protein